MDMYLLCGMGVLLVSLVFCASRMRGCVREGQEDGLEDLPLQPGRLAFVFSSVQNFPSNYRVIK